MYQAFCCCRTCFETAARQRFLEGEKVKVFWQDWENPAACMWHGAQVAPGKAPCTLWQGVRVKFDSDGSEYTVPTLNMFAL